MKIETLKLILAGILNIATTIILNFAYYIYLGDCKRIPWSGEEGLRYLWIIFATSPCFIILSFLSFMIYRYREVSLTTYFLNAPLPIYTLLGTFLPIYDGKLMRTHLGLIFCPILYAIMISAFLSTLLSYFFNHNSQVGKIKVITMVVLSYSLVQFIGLYMSFRELLQ